LASSRVLARSQTIDERRRTPDVQAIGAARGGRIERKGGAMDHRTIDLALVIDTFLLLLIGIGPKIALVPFVETTAEMDSVTKARVVRKMLVTASVVAVLLIFLGELLARLLHFSTGSLSLAGGILLVIIAVSMVLRSDDPHHGPVSEHRDPMRVAVFPLAIPYLLNPAGDRDARDHLS